MPRRQHLPLVRAALTALLLAAAAAVAAHPLVISVQSDEFWNRDGEGTIVLGGKGPAQAFTDLDYQAVAFSLEGKPGGARVVVEERVTHVMLEQEGRTLDVPGTERTGPWTALRQDHGRWRTTGKRPAELRPTRAELKSALAAPGITADWRSVGERCRDVHVPPCGVAWGRVELRFRTDAARADAAPDLVLHFRTVHD